MKTPPLIVPDENVFVSGTTIATTPPAQIMQAWKNDQIEVATSEPILESLEKVLSYEKVRRLTKMSKEEIESYITYVRSSAIVVPGTTPVNISSDPKDNKIFACAIEAKAGYIVSGDKKHILSIDSYKDIKTINPRNFVEKVLFKLREDADSSEKEFLKLK